MTAPIDPSAPPPPAPQPKKGLPVIAWVGIGCGGLIVLAVIALVVVSMVFGNLAKDFVAEMEKNPARATAELMAKFDKNIEIVSSDDEKQTVTIRTKSTGEVVTLTAEDFENGRYPGNVSGSTNSAAGTESAP